MSLWNKASAKYLNNIYKHLYFLRQLRKFGISQAGMTHFYRAAIESVLTFSILVWVVPPARTNNSLRGYAGPLKSLAVVCLPYTRTMTPEFPGKLERSSLTPLIQHTTYSHSYHKGRGTEASQVKHHALGIVYLQAIRHLNMH